jgi:hypothetical protein
MAKSQQGSGSDKGRSSQAEVAGKDQQERGSGATSGETNGPVAGVQAQAGQIVGAAKEQATGQIAEQKERAASRLETMADALSAAGQHLRDSEEQKIAQYVDTTADQVQRLARALRDQDVTQLMQTATEFGRRQPALFLAATFALGFAATRFLRSSSQSQGSGSGRESSWDTGSSRGVYGRMGEYDAVIGSEWSGTSGYGSDQEGR